MIVCIMYISILVRYSTFLGYCVTLNFSWDATDAHMLVNHEKNVMPLDVFAY